MCVKGNHEGAKSKCVARMTGRVVSRVPNAPTIGVALPASIIDQKVICCSHIAVFGTAQGSRAVRLPLLICKWFGRTASTYFFFYIKH